MDEHHHPTTDDQERDRGPRRRFVRVASTLLGGAIAGAAVAAPLTLHLDRDPHPAPAETAVGAADTTEASPVTAPASGGIDVNRILDAARPAVVAIRPRWSPPRSPGPRQGRRREAAS